MRLRGLVASVGVSFGFVLAAVAVGLLAGQVVAADDAGVMVDPNTTPVQGVAPPNPRPVGGSIRPGAVNPQAGQPMQGVMPTPPAASQPTFTGPPPAVKVDELVYDFGRLIGVDSV